MPLHAPKLRKAPTHASSGRDPGASDAFEQAFLNVKSAARYLGVSPKTLYVWRHRRQGPPSFRLGPRGRVAYRLTALDAWVSEQERADSRSNDALNPLNGSPGARTPSPLA
ncbi:helix-turn-helix transcriptional regulator [Streptomyces sp. NPDC017940]|uniref:helix-turn-helix transcriptional regulator n=1 Tax=Streptomyces sp. NPDC017940 TaxID=3365017 RepID=UPI0037A82D60